MKIVLWGQRAVEFEAQLVYDNGQNLPVVGVFVGLLMKSYNSKSKILSSNRLPVLNFHTECILDLLRR